METRKVVDREAFEEVVKLLEDGQPLTLSMVGDVFLAEFWMLIVECFLDSQDAARAIQNSINRLRAGEGIDVSEDEDFDE